MIKKSVHEQELIIGMQRELSSQSVKQGMTNLVKAADYLNAAIEILEDAGMTAKADRLLAVMAKIAADEQDAKKKVNIDKHTSGLTPDKMVENLKNHGIVFNLSDDGFSADDMLDLDIGENQLEVGEGASYQKDFEDED